MQRTGVANLPLHLGKCPPWLFRRMKRLAGQITKAILLEYSQEEFLRRLSDPFWFQSFGNVLGFDWHSSGISTTVCGALKESVDPEETGIAIAGGKGATSRKTPNEIELAADNFSLSTAKLNDLKYSSRMAAKVDSAVLQDSYELYHHAFVFSENGSWAVIQQGLNSENSYARRYHWLSDNVKSFVEEPHNAICCDKRNEEALDMTSRGSRDARDVSLAVVNDDCFSSYAKQRTLTDFSELSMPKRHHIIDMNKRNIETLKKAYEYQPKSYEELVSLKGIGPKTIRSLAMISEVVFGKPPSWKDPVKYSFAHGGKDGIPYPVNRKVMDESTSILRTAIENAKLGEKDRFYAIKRLTSKTI